MNEYKSSETHDCKMCQHISSLILSLPPDCLSMSSSIDKLASSLIKATGDMGFITKDRAGTERGGKKIYYADINAVLEESKPKLKENGLALYQPTLTDDKGFHRIGNLLMHESGQFIWSSLVMEKNQQNIQSFGGDITYLRRYTCVSFLGIAQEDNDGNHNQYIQEKKPTYNKPIVEKNVSNQQLVVKEQKKINADQYKILYNVDYDIRQVILDTYKIKTINDLTEEQAEKVIDQLSK